MPLFIVCSLILSLLVQSESPLLLFLESPAVIAIGLIAAAASVAGAALKRLPNAIWFDLFATAMLAAWFAYWRSVFKPDAPMFFFFPLYYTLLGSVLALVFINRAERFDAESVAQLRILVNITRLDTSTIVVFVLLSVAITRHYMLYPIAMTLFLVRYALTRCLEIVGK